MVEILKKMYPLIYRHLFPNVSLLGEVSFGPMASHDELRSCNSIAWRIPEALSSMSRCMLPLCSDTVNGRSSAERKLFLHEVTGSLFLERDIAVEFFKCIFVTL